MKLIEQLSTKNDCYQKNVAKADSRYTTFQLRGPRGLMLHSVGTAQPNAQVFANGWNKSGLDVAVHAVLQSDGTVYQCLPWNFRGWHAGGDANNTHLGIEMTEPSQITYTSGSRFTVNDSAAAKAQCAGTYRTAVELFAALCHDYGLDPMTDIISHAEGSAKGIASNHGDPEHLWRGLGMDYTMDGFRRDVRDRLRPKEDNDMMSKEQILAALGDQYIATYSDLPSWAKPEVRQMLDLGLIRGSSAEDPDDIGMLLSDIRIAIVAYRAFRMSEKKK